MMTLRLYEVSVLRLDYRLRKLCNAGVGKMIGRLSDGKGADKNLHSIWAEVGHVQCCRIVGCGYDDMNCGFPRRRMDG